jgi:hypothetical protein
MGSTGVATPVSHTTGKEKAVEWSVPGSSPGAYAAQGSHRAREEPPFTAMRYRPWQGRAWVPAGQ